MGLFNRKKKSEETETSATFTHIEPPQECNHKWQDFPWYIEGKYYVDKHFYEFDIIEPYVCLRCHERENKVLAHVARQGSSDDADRMIDQLVKQYDGKVKHKAEVEDMIQDTIMIDPDFLKYFYMMNGGKNPSVSTEGYRSDTSNNDDEIKLKL